MFKKLISKGLQLAAVALLCSCRVPAYPETSSNAGTNRIYLWNAKAGYQEVISDFAAENNVPIEVHSRQGDIIVLDVMAGKMLTSQLNQQLREAGIFTSVD